MSRHIKASFALCFVYSLCLFTLLASSAWAQTTSATINGTVTDETGSIIPGAQVTVTNEETSVKTTTQSNEAGAYTVTGLPSGRYTVTFTKEGFQTYIATGTYLGPAVVRGVNATMKIGAVVSEITVRASTTQVQTSTSEVSNHVAQAQVETLPLNGRNYQGLAALMPGVVNVSAGHDLGTGGRSTRNVMSVNGMGSASSLYTVDGVWNMNTGNMAQTTVLPNPDSIQEVRVLQNNYSPKYSLMGASVIMLQTRGGTQKVHGSLFEYLRNDALDARNFFSAKVPVQKQSIFGGTIGGPFVVPGRYNTSREKTFFFGSVQGVTRNRASIRTGATPTAEMRNGIFSRQIIDPDTGQPFLQNSAGQWVIPQSKINRNALALMNALAELPNNPAGGFNNFINVKPERLRQIDSEIKVDHNFSQKVRLTAEYFDTHQWFTQSAIPPISGSTSPFTTTFEKDLTRNKLAQVKLTMMLTPSMVNQVSVAMNNYVLDLLLQGKGRLSDVADFKSILPFNGFGSDRLPLVQFAGGWSSFGAPRSRPLEHASDLEDTLADDWSWLKGSHFLEAGLNYVASTKRQLAFAASQGEWFFSGRFTGDPIADYLLGDSFTFFQHSTGRRPYIHGRIVSPYFQDRWKVNRRLTLNLGLRLSFMPQPHPQSAFETVFDPSRFDRSKAPIVNPDGTITPTANYDPLNGLIRNGVGGVPNNFTNEHQWYWQPMVGFAYDVFGDGKTSLRGGYGITNTRAFTTSDNTYFAGTNPPEVQSITLVNPKFPNPVGTGAVRPPGAPSLQSEDLDLRAVQIHTYSLTLEHEFPGNWILSVGGAGNFARHVTQQYDRNQPRPIPGFDFDPAINPGGFTYLNPPFPGYATITTNVSLANAYWNGLLVSARHPVGRNLFLTASYTWSHGLSQTRGSESTLTQGAAAQNIYNPLGDYGSSNINIPNLFSLSYIWSLPWLEHASGWKGAVLGGWKYSGITIIQSGFSLDPGLSVSNRGLATRPNLVGSVNGPRIVSQWFNTGALVPPAFGFFGNAGAGIIRGPGLVNFDMAFYKDFRIGENRTIEFRSEFFNIFNHTNFEGVSLARGAGNFGRVTTARDPRIVEFALRFQF